MIGAGRWVCVCVYVVADPGPFSFIVTSLMRAYAKHICRRRTRTMRACVCVCGCRVYLNFQPEIMSTSSSSSAVARASNGQTNTYASRTRHRNTSQHNTQKKTHARSRFAHTCARIQFCRGVVVVVVAVIIVVFIRVSSPPAPTSE